MLFDHHYAALYRYLRRQGGDDLLSALLGMVSTVLRPEGNHQLMFALVVQCVSTPDLRPRVAAEVYQAAARVPGIELIQRTTDPVGRPGMALAMTASTGDRTELIFEPATGRFLGERVQSGQGSGPASEPGAVLTQRAVLASGPVDSVEATLGP